MEGWRWDLNSLTYAIDRSILTPEISMHFVRFICTWYIVQWTLLFWTKEDNGWLKNIHCRWKSLVVYGLVYE